MSDSKDFQLIPAGAPGGAVLGIGSGPVYELDSWSIDLSQRVLRLEGQTIALGGRAFELLAVLVSSSGEVVSKDLLMAQVWPGAIVEESTLQVHISAIRKALGAARGMLQTSSGRGYQLRGGWRIRREAVNSTVSAGAIVLPPPPSFNGNLPAARSSLVGREPLVHHLHDVISAYRAITLTGPGGIGKTVLAMQIARDLSPYFGGAVVAVELTGVVDPTLVASTVAVALDLTLTSVTSTNAVAHAIGERKLLLILDNCEHVIDAVAALAEAILRRCPRTTLLATSREILRVDGEYVVRIPPLDVPSAGDTDSEAMAQSSAVRLFVRRVLELNAQFESNTANFALAAMMCRQLDGIPLAIEFAASRAATLGVREVVARLDDRFRLLTSGRRVALPRHQTLRAVFEWSYDLLPEVERTTLCHLAIFVASFPIGAAIVVMAETGQDEEAVIESVSALVDKSLLMPDDTSGQQRWRMLETVRAYALQRLRDAGQSAAAARVHATYYRTLFDAPDARKALLSRLARASDYGRELDNVRAALDWAFSAEGDAKLGVHLTIAVVPLLVQLSLLNECHDRANRALSTLEDHAGNAEARMRLSAGLGWSLMFGIGPTRLAGAAWTTTLHLAQLLGDAEHLRHALWGLCIDQFNSGSVQVGLSYAERFDAVTDRSAPAIERMKAERLLATAQHYAGDQKRARHHIERALLLEEAIPTEARAVSAGFDPIVSTHYFQARILWLQGFADTALRVVAANVKEGQALGHALSFCSVLGQSACPLTFLSGDFEAAETYCAMLLEHTSRNPIRLWNIWARCFSGLVAVQRGAIEPGIARLNEGLSAAGEALTMPRFQLLRAEQARVLGDVGKVSTALEILNQMLEACEARQENWFVPELLRLKAEMLLKDGHRMHMVEVQQLLDLSVSEAHRQGALAWELRAVLSLTRLRLDEGRGDALGPLASVYRRFKEGLKTKDLLAARRLLGIH